MIDPEQLAREFANELKAQLGLEILRQIVELNGSRNKKMRGANPFSCKICDPQIRDVCPAYQSVKDHLVLFNEDKFDEDEFLITTSGENNDSNNQQFESVEGNGVEDDYSPNDRPRKFKSYPHPAQQGAELTVEEFIKMY